MSGGASVLGTRFAPARTLSARGGPPSRFPFLQEHKRAHSGRRGHCFTPEPKVDTREYFPDAGLFPPTGGSQSGWGLSPDRNSTTPVGGISAMARKNRKHHNRPRAPPEKPGLDLSDPAARPRPRAFLTGGRAFLLSGGWYPCTGGGRQQRAPMGDEGQV